MIPPQPKKRPAKKNSPAKESPEEHVHESVGRQKKAAEEVAKTAEKVAKTAEAKAMTLAAATELLSSRVNILAGAVQITNQKIDDLQREVNCKPDDAEVQFISGLAKAERKALFTRISSGAIAAAVVASLVAYGIANYESQQGCQTNAKNIETLVSILEQNPRTAETFASQIADLESNRNKC